MRATSPLDQLQYFGDFVEVPRPAYPVGTKIHLSLLNDDNRKYYFRKVLREILKRIRVVITKLKREGYLVGMKKNKMMDHNKERVRQMLDMVRFADSVELVGSEPQGMHVVGTVGNQCYLQNGQCHSGVSYSYFLLFRRKVDGNDVVYVHPEALIHEHTIKLLSPVLPKN